LLPLLLQQLDRSLLLMLLHLQRPLPWLLPQLTAAQGLKQLQQQSQQQRQQQLR
jgi:hypothetical protein